MIGDTLLGLAMDLIEFQNVDLTRLVEEVRQPGQVGDTGMQYCRTGSNVTVCAIHNFAQMELVEGIVDVRFHHRATAAEVLHAPPPLHLFAVFEMLKIAHRPYQDWQRAEGALGFQ